LLLVGGGVEVLGLGAGVEELGFGVGVAPPLDEELGVGVDEPLVPVEVFLVVFFLPAAEVLVEPLVEPELEAELDDDGAAEAELFEPEVPSVEFVAAVLFSAPTEKVVPAAEFDPMA
jgi:hypothetical protein